VPTVERPTYVLHIGELVAGRRLLSDDRALLDAAAGIAARRIDHLRLTHERFARELREEEMQKLAAEAELRALRAQINPHFLFNALTTIGYLIEATPARALETLMGLTSLLRGVLRSDGEFTTLGREIELVEHYLDIERARFEERLRVRIDVPRALHALRVPSLLLQPLVENAVKHGIAPSRLGGEVEVTASLAPGATGQHLRLRVRNTGSDLGGPSAGGAGVGLTNVQRRLAGHFGTGASLTLTTPQPGRVVAEIVLPSMGTVDHETVAAR
jgi:LytS/YehU family sensor histidine kinase